MTNAREDFSLDAELDADRGLGPRTTSTTRRPPTTPTPPTTSWESGYADDDPELTDRRAGPRRALRPAPGRRALRPSSRTSPRSSTASSGWSGSSWSASGPTARVEDAENSMAELAALAETAGSEVLDAIYQRRDKPDPATYIGRGKVEGLARDRAGHRRRHRDLRRRARAQPAAQPRGQAQGQGRRPDRADPRHLRPARQEQGGPGAGRAGPAQLHEAAPARLGRQPLPPGRWPGRRRRGHRWPWPR